MDESKKIILELTLDELKLIDKYVEYNEETKSVFDKIKDAYPQPKMTLQQEGDYAVVSYNDTTYYRLMGEDSCFCWYKRGGVSANHPVPTLVFVTDAETDRLLEGLYYNDIMVKKEKEMIRQNLKTSLEELANGDVRPIDDVIEEAKEEQVADGLKEAFRKVVSSTKSKTLTDLIYRWWSDVFTTHSDWDMETSIEDLVDQIELFLPKEQSAAGSQNAYVESAVEGFNDAIKQIKSKLR